MKNLKKIFTITISVIFLFIVSKDVRAAEACPESMPAMDRYLCLQKQLSKLESNQSNLQKKLKNEDYQQLTLNEKLKYIDTQIQQTESVIETLGIEIAAKDIEINMLNEEVTAKENDLSTLRQEINALEQTVGERVIQSYKYSHVGPFEVLLDFKGFDNVIRKLKYLLETRTNDKNSLAAYADKKDQLEKEQEVLTTKQLELQNKRAEVEEEKKRLAEEKKYLDEQKAEKQVLLAESQRREEAYKKELAETTAMISKMDEMISDYVIQLFNSNGLGNGSRVSAGSIIGLQGHTGCAFGSHLHFEIRNKYDVKQDPSLYLGGGEYWSLVTSAKYLAPMRRARITQTYKLSPRPHRAWDMVSTIDGDQSGSTYKVTKGICDNVDYYMEKENREWAFLTGEGAPIKAITSGTVYYGVYSTDLPQYTCKYALLVHDDGNKSFYLHLK